MKSDMALSHPFFDFLRKACKKQPAVESALLFGSRARGDSAETSDFDVAFVAPQITDEDWARFCLDLRESAPTLCALDLVRADGPLREELREHIFLEGKIIYEREKD